MKSVVLFFIVFCVSILFIAQQFHLVNCAVPFLPQVNGIEANTKFDPRIVGGAKAQEGEARGIVSLQSKNGHFCGGTWIKYGNKTAILTAAHCIVDYEGQLDPKKSVRAMGDDISISYHSPSPRRQVRIVKKIVPHAQYDDFTKDNDIAMIFLETPFEETSTFGPISIADRDILDNQTCVIAGWGHTREKWFKSDQLLIANVSVVPRGICDGPSAYDGTVGKHAFCAGSIDGGIDSCQGDSGGGIMSQNKYVGIVSWGEGCARRNFPGIYTNAFRYRGWIEETINAPSSATQPTIVTLSIVFAAIFTRSMF